MPLYESVFIVRQDVSSAQAEQLAADFSEIITNMGGEIKKTEFWGLRSLAYKIKKNRKGHYVLLHIDAPAEAITEMERLMRLNEDVLRYISLRLEEIPEGPSAIVLAKTNVPSAVAVATVLAAVAGSTVVIVRNVATANKQPAKPKETD